MATEDVASLGLEIETTPLVRARDEFGRFVKGASAAEIAAQRWGLTTAASARTAQTAVTASARATENAVNASARATENAAAASTRAAAQSKMVFDRFAMGAAGAGKAAQEWGSAWDHVTVSSSKVVAGSTAATRAIDMTTAATVRSRNELGQFVKANDNAAKASMATYAGMSRASMATYAGMGSSATDFGAIAAMLAAKLTTENKQSGASFAELATGVTSNTARMSNATRVAGDVGKGIGAGIRSVTGLLGPLAAAFTVAAIASKAWSAGMKAADLGEQAAQLNVSTDALQAYRFEAAQAGIGNGQLDQSLIRLTAALGAAGKGGEAQIKMFDKLGVKVLDANGELRQTEDIIPELARGLLSLGSETQRNAMLTELFGRSGARMTTVLEAWAKGNEKVIAGAKEAGAVMDKEVIKAWDDLADAMVRTNAVTDTALAKLGAPIATWALEKVEAILKSIIGHLDAMKKIEATTASRAASADVSNLNDRIAAEKNLLAINPNNKMAQQSLAALEKQALSAKKAVVEAKASEAQVAMEGDDDWARRHKLPGVDAPPKQAVPTGSKSGGAAKEDPYEKIVQGSKSYVEQKRMEISAVGESAETAARLKHSYDLLNAATEANIKLGPQQRTELLASAAEMAKADVALEASRFLNDEKTKTEDFLREQQMERDALTMGAEAVTRMRIEQELLNDAKKRGILDTPGVVDAIKQEAAARAESQEKTRRYSEQVQLAKDVTSGFMRDINQGIRDGAGVWEILGNAAMNALTMISDKLMQMAIDKLWENAFPAKGGASSSGGGIGDILGGVVSFVGGLFGGGTTPGSGMTFAKGGVFDKGNVVPFARGGVIDKPMNFPLAGNRTGLAGEAGPEGILPLRRTRNGALGVMAEGASGRGSGAGGNIFVHVSLNDDKLNMTIDNRSTAIVKRAAPAIENNAVEKSGDQVPARMEKDKEEAHGDWRTR